MCFAETNFCDLDRVVFLAIFKKSRSNALIAFSLLFKTCNQNTDFKTTPCIYKANCSNHSITITPVAPGVSDGSSDGQTMTSLSRFISVQYIFARTHGIIFELLHEIEHDRKNYQCQDLCYLPKPKFKMDKWSTALCKSQKAHSVPCSSLFLIPAMSHV